LEREDMKFDYTKLWKLLESRNMYREDLRIETGMSSATLAKLGKNEAVSMDVLGRICKALNCDIGDIVSCMEDKE
jgi:putative transcriptional regulator